MDQPLTSPPPPQWEALGTLEYTPTACPICGAREAELRYAKQIRDIAMRYYLCAHCRALYANPRATVDSLRNLYSSKAFFEGSEPGGDHLNYFSFLADEPFLRRTARTRIARIRRHCPTGRMLEVASAAGFFLIEAKHAGYDVSGVEFSRALAAYAQARWAVPVLPESIEDVDLRDHAYDVIASWGVMTIIQDPLALVRKFHRALKPGGLWAFNTYSHDGLWARLVGKRWDILTVNLSQIYTRQLLVDVISRQGFTLVERERDMPYTGLMKVADKLSQTLGLGALPRMLAALHLGDVIVRLPLPDVLTYLWRRDETH
jgi:SAM-dependent methyltransferase